MENKYYYRYICSNGHSLNEMGKTQVPEHPYCYMCGAQVISICQNCNAQIKGYNMGDYPIGELPIPNYCYNCAEPFPWTKLLIDKAIELVSLDKKLKESDKEVIKNELPNLLVDSIETPISQAKIKILMDKMTPNISNMFVQLLGQFINQNVLEQLTN